MKWFRFYAEALDDPKVQRLPGELYKAWVNLLCLANQGTERGVLPSREDIAFRLRMTDDEAAEVISALIDRELLDEIDGDLVPHNWDGRQPKSDNVTERVQRHRAKRNPEQLEEEGETEAPVTRNVTETPKPVTRNAPDKNRRDTETDTDQKRVDIAGSPPAETPAALVDAYCQVREQPFPEDAGPFVNIAKGLVKRGYSSADVDACTRYMLTDPYWQDRMTFKSLASTLPEWAHNGRPDRAPPKPENGRARRAREPDFSGIEAFGERMKAMEQPQ